VSCGCWLCGLDSSGQTHVFEHFQAGNGNALRAAICHAILQAPVAPLSAGTGVEQDTDENQVDQATAALVVVDRLGHRRQQFGDTVAAADGKMLVPAVWWDGVEGGIIIALAKREMGVSSHTLTHTHTHSLSLSLSPTLPHTHTLSPLSP